MLRDKSTCSFGDHTKCISKILNQNLKDINDVSDEIQAGKCLPNCKSLTRQIQGIRVRFFKSMPFFRLFLVPKKGYKIS